MGGRAATLVFVFLFTLLANYSAGLSKRPRWHASHSYELREMKEYNSPLFKKDNSINKAALRNRSRLWPNATVFYEISRNYGPLDRRQIASAMQQIEASTCVRFVPRTSNERNYIYINQTGKGCFSRIGMVGGAQTVSLDSACLKQNLVTAVHELMHVLGFYHEHARYDRDRYVKVNLLNVKPEDHINFHKLDQQEITQLGVEYDKESVLHYGYDDLGIEPQRPTIIGLHDNKDQFSNHDGLTKKDVVKIKRLYHCDADDLCWDDDPIACRRVIEKHGPEHCRHNRTFMARDCRETCGYCGQAASKKTSTTPATTTSTAASSPARPRLDDEDDKCQDDEHVLCWLLSRFGRFFCEIGEQFTNACKRTCGVC